jgi:hypothetical protein
VALEKMKYGLPVVVAAASGLSELYTSYENAIIVPLHKADSDLMKLELRADELTETLTTILNSSFAAKVKQKCTLSMETIIYS